MKTLLDVHTHTIASGHAFSTLQEMVQAASEKGVRLLGITEHAHSMPGSCAPVYFRNLHVVPRRLSGVELLLGAELNILDYRGTIDMTEEELGRLEIRIAGLHSLCYTPGTTDQNTDAVLGAIRNPYIHIISHPGDGVAQLHFEPLVLASKKYHTLLEINNSSLNPARHKRDARDNNLTILRLCKQYGVPVILGSDAHISFDIARYDFLYPLLQETDFPEQLLMNDKVEAFKALLRQHVTSCPEEEQKSGENTGTLKKYM